MDCAIIDDNELTIMNHFLRFIRSDWAICLMVITGNPDMGQIYAFYSLWQLHLASVRDRESYKLQGSVGIHPFSQITECLICDA